MCLYKLSKKMSISILRTLTLVLKAVSRGMPVAAFILITYRETQRHKTTWKSTMKNA